MGPKVTYTGW